MEAFRLIEDPPRSTWKELTSRPKMDTSSRMVLVQRILGSVRREGDPAVRRFTREFDRVDIPEAEVSPAEWEQGISRMDPELKDAIGLASRNIDLFHRAQQEPVRKMELLPGVNCWRKSLPIQRVGLYVPGGTAPLFSSILMLGIPARIAGCPQVILCSPPGPEGLLHPAVLYSARLAGIQRIFKIGGIQAIGAMAYGTATVPASDKLFGPGNAWVTLAKNQVQQDGIAIDFPAGPSELAVLADDSCRADFVAADLLSQAEHGTDSQVLLLLTDRSPYEAIRRELCIQLEGLPRRELARKALENSRALYFPDTGTAMDFLNSYAPEHLILACREPATLADQVSQAGSVFLGHYSPESAGDYASGTNHTLPTYGYARAYGGISLDSFLRKVTFQQISPQGLRRLGPAIISMARAEGLEAHGRAVSLRLEQETGGEAFSRDLKPS